MTRRREPLWKEVARTIMGFIIIGLFCLVMPFIFLWAILQDWREGLLFWDEETCPNCGHRMKESGFPNHSRRWTCPYCNNKITEREFP